MVKGAGVDCCTLPVMIYKEAGMADISIETNYSCDWFTKRPCKEILLPYLKQYFEQVKELLPADIVSFRYCRSEYAHVALYLGDGKFIHADANNGVEIVTKDCPFFFDKSGKSRITGYWRLRK